MGAVVDKKTKDSLQHEKLKPRKQFNKQDC